MIRFLQNRDHPFRIRAAVCLALAHDLQERIDRNALFEADALFERYESPGVWNWFSGRLEKLTENPDFAKTKKDTEQALLSLFDHLEVLSYESASLSSENQGKSFRPQPGCRAGFSSLFTDTMAEQILIYFVFTYFCGAVYGGSAYGKMKFSLAGTILIRELAPENGFRPRSSRTRHNPRGLPVLPGSRAL